MNEFKSFHPIVNFVYFAMVISFTMFILHPICLVIAGISSVIYSAMLKGKAALKFDFFVLVPVVLITALINPLFSHEGATIISYLPGGNPLTLESVIYGAVTGTVIATVICWFSCYSEVMTSDRFIYIFGGIIPSTSLIFSMTLRLVSRFKRRFKMVKEAHSHIGYGENFVGRVKNAVKLLSIMLTWSVESSVDTADSMRSRGYGIKGRTAFSNFRFGKRDFAALIYMLGTGAYVMVAIFRGKLEYSYFPNFSAASGGLYLTSTLFAYALLCLAPVFIEIAELLRWRVRRDIPK